MTAMDDNNNVLLDDLKPVRDDQQNTGDICFHIVLHRREETHFTIKMADNQSCTVAIDNIHNAAGEVITGIGDSLVLTPSNLTSTSLTESECSIKANRYIEFDLHISNRANIVKLYTPSFYSYWDMSQLSDCENIVELRVRGNVEEITDQNQTHTRYLQNMSNLSVLRFECNPDVLIDLADIKTKPITVFRTMLREYSLPKGESYVLDVDKVQQFQNKNLLTTFTTLGNYSFPMRGVRGSLDSFELYFPALSELVFKYNSITPISASIILETIIEEGNVIYNRQLPVEVNHNLDSSIYQNLPSNE